MADTMSRPDTASQVQSFLNNLGNLNLVQVEALLHDDCVFETPYGGAVRRVKGKKAVMDYLSTAMVSFIKRLDFTITETYRCTDQNVVIMEYESDGELRDGGHYGNKYVSITAFQDDKIILFREYYNPAALSAARSN